MADAASAAATFLYFHQKDESALQSLQYYRQQEGATDENLQSREPLPFARLYATGVLAHEEKRWPAAITFMEKAATRLYEDYNLCRSKCESTVVTRGKERSSFLEIATGIHGKLAECRVQCWLESGWSVSERGPLDVAPSIYHYLQFDYYQGESLRWFPYRSVKNVDHV